MVYTRVWIDALHVMAWRDLEQPAFSCGCQALYYGSSAPQGIGQFRA